MVVWNVRAAHGGVLLAVRGLAEVRYDNAGASKGVAWRVRPPVLGFLNSYPADLLEFREVSKQIKIDGTVQTGQTTHATWLRISVFFAKNMAARKLRVQCREWDCCSAPAT